MSDIKRPFTITRVLHTGITVSSLQDALHFWVDVLGFRLVSREEGASGDFIDDVVGVKGAKLSLAVVEAPGHRIELLEYHAPPDRRIMKPRSCDVGSFHIGFVVDDFDAVLVKCEQEGWHELSFSKSLLEKAWRRMRSGWQRLAHPQGVREGGRAGARQAYVRGPDGTTIELREEREAVE